MRFLCILEVVLLLHTAKYALLLSSLDSLKRELAKIGIVHKDIQCLVAKLNEKYYPKSIVARRRFCEAHEHALDAFKVGQLPLATKAHASDLKCFDRAFFENAFAGTIYNV